VTRRGEGLIPPATFTPGQPTPADRRLTAILSLATIRPVHTVGCFEANLTSRARLNVTTRSRSDVNWLAMASAMRDLRAGIVIILLMIITIPRLGL
jgi:hypothetical protein